MYVVRRTYKDLEILHLAGDFTHLRNALFLRGSCHQQLLHAQLAGPVS